MSRFSVAFKTILRSRARTSIVARHPLSVSKNGNKIRYQCGPFQMRYNFHSSSRVHQETKNEKTIDDDGNKLVSQGNPVPGCKYATRKLTHHFKYTQGTF